MASSSSSSAAFPSKKYHVFISFRGEDTRHNFISHLHDALCRSNIETYIDYRLEKGEEVWPSLEKAIHDSMMFLIVFSENYATSTWCLKELTTILKCSKEEGLHVIPVFYKIDPSHIRKQKGSYKTAFRNHELSNSKQQVLKWRDALTYAANLSGWDSSTYRNEVELIREIVRGVFRKLEPVYQNIYLDGLVGIKEKIQKVELLMHNSLQDVRFIGIWGMPGIGKTTIAKALFNKLCFSFDSFCFLANVKEEYERLGIEHLKYKLISILLGDKESYKGVPDGGSTYVGMRLRQKKVLVVLDDINHYEQLKILAGARNWFGPGSRIIITTRDKELLGENVGDTYEVELLKSHEALQLFKMNAFKEKFCDEEFKCLSLKFIDYANGLPLAVIVLGRSLYGKDKRIWKCQLEKLRKMPHKDIQRILRVSYEGLDREEKQIFLDVACFFNSKRVETIESSLHGFGFSTTVGIQSLQDKALLNISVFGDVFMHDLIQEMGKEVVREECLEDPGKRSRLWDPKDICQILKDNKGSDAIRSISLDMSKAEDLCLSPQAFSKMSNLSFFEIYNSSHFKKHVVHLPQGLGNFPPKLRYLSWDDYPSKSLPSTFSAEKLVELHMPNSGMRKLWCGVQNVVNLKKINLSNSKHLTELPDLSKAKNLDDVRLRNCESIREVPPSILSQKLESLILDGCVAVRNLNSDTELRSLFYLSVSGCSNLKEFSIIAENLDMLDLRMTAIEEVPPCIGHMPELGRLDLSSDKSMMLIRSDLFDGLHSLNELYLGNNCNILEVVNNVSKLSSLTIEANSIKSLPKVMMHLSNLYTLVLKNCTRLRSLPEQLPPSLHMLQVYGCPDLGSIPQLTPYLQSLIVEDCTRLRSIPQLPPSLELLTVENCSSLETVQVTLTPGKLQSSVIENCFKLDEHSAKAILANVILVCKKFSSKEYKARRCFEVRYPGGRVPEWLKYKTTHPSVVLDLSSAPLSFDWALLCCVVTTPSTVGINVRCQYQIRVANDELAKWDVEYLLYNGSTTTSNHVHLWFDNSVSQKMHPIIERKATSNSKILLQVEFYVFNDIEESQPEEDEENPSMLPIEM